MTFVNYNKHVEHLQSINNDHCTYYLMKLMKTTFIIFTLFLHSFYIPFTFLLHSFLHSFYIPFTLRNKKHNEYRKNIRNIHCTYNEK